jgi:hypothetical protein
MVFGVSQTTTSVLYASATASQKCGPNGKQRHPQQRQMVVQAHQQQQLDTDSGVGVDDLLEEDDDEMR